MKVELAVIETKAGYTIYLNDYRIKGVNTTGISSMDKKVVLETTVESEEVLKSTQCIDKFSKEQIDFINTHFKIRDESNYWLAWEGNC